MASMGDVWRIRLRWVWMVSVSMAGQPRETLPSAAVFGCHYLLSFGVHYLRTRRTIFSSFGAFSSHQAYSRELCGEKKMCVK